MYFLPAPPPPETGTSVTGTLPVAEMVEAVETIAPVPLSPAVVSVPDPEIEEEDPVTVALPMNRRLALAEIEDEEPVIAPVPENLSEPLAAIVLWVEVIAAVPINRNAPLAKMVDAVEVIEPDPVNEDAEGADQSRSFIVFGLGSLPNK